MRGFGRRTGCGGGRNKNNGGCRRGGRGHGTGGGKGGGRGRRG